LGVAVRPKLHGRREVVEDGAPVALVIGAAPVALVHDDEVEEVRRVLAKVRRAHPRPAHEGLEDGEEDAAVLGHAPFFLISSGAIRTSASVLEGEKALYA
jgi:fructoselysine-6-P-deglycase FrlB-like protein